MAFTRRALYNRIRAECQSAILDGKRVRVPFSGRILHLFISQLIALGTGYRGVIKQGQTSELNAPVTRTYPRHWQAGDLLLVNVETERARLLKTLLPDTAFSHVGIVGQEVDDNPLVYHCLPAASGRSGMQRIPVDQFLLLGQGFGHTHLRLRNEAELLGARAAARAENYHKDQIAFDSMFQLWSEKALYCSEMVWRAYLHAGMDLLNGKFTALQLLGTESPFILPDDLAQSEHLELIGSVAE